IEKMLKQLMIQRKLDNAKSLLEQLREKDEKFKIRTEELEASIEEAKTDEEIEAVEEEVENLEKEKKDHDEEKQKLEDEIAQLEEELEELNRNAPKNNDSQGGRRNMDKEQLKEVRSAINAYVRSKGAEVRQVEGFKLVDGGALVPQEFLSPEKTPEDVVDLLRYVKNVPVKSSSGKYPVIKKSGSRMNTVAELEANPELQKPQVTEVNHSVDTYRGYIPVSQEVIDDADYDIVGLIDEEIRDQELNTRNFAIASVLKTA